MARPDALSKISGALLLIAASALSVPTQAASWGGGQPAWAAGGDSGSQSRRSKERYNPAQEVSPFSPGSNNISIDVGQVFLMGDLADRYDSSIGTQIHYTYGVSDLFGFDGSVSYSEHANGAFSMITALLGVRTNLAWYDKVVPYGVFGMGFYKPNYSLTSAGTVPNGAANQGSTTSVSPLLFGVHLGPGVDLALTKQIFFGASLTFHDIFGNNQMVNGKPFDVGGTFTTFLIRAGVTF